MATTAITRPTATKAMKPAYRRPLIRKRNFGIPTVHPDACEFERPNVRRSSPATLAAVGRCSATHAAPRHNGGHSLIEPSNPSRVRAKDRSRTADFIGSCARFWRKARRRMQIAAWSVPMDVRQAAPASFCQARSRPLPAGARQRLPILTSPAGLMQLVRNLRPGHPAVLQLPLGHGSELAPGPGPLPPDPHDLHQRPPGPHDH